METCPVCIDGRLITKISRAGEETYCTDCRRIVASATLGFQFKPAGNPDEAPVACRGPEGDPRPGFKGPGAKAKCWLYDDGDEAQKKAAEKKARSSAYSTQHKRSASKIINSTPFFTGAPSFGGMTAPAADNTASPDLSQSVPPPNNMTAPPQSPIGEATAPGGVQPGDLNSNMPVNSGTTASTRLSELLEEMI